LKDARKVATSHGARRSRRRFEVTRETCKKIRGRGENTGDGVESKMMKIPWGLG